MKNPVLLFTFLWLLFFLPLKIFSQCCSLGGPISGDASLGVVKTGNLRIYTIYKHSESNRYFEGDQLISSSVLPAEGLNVENSFFDYTGINIAYGLAKKISIEAEGGYFISKTQNFINPSDSKTMPKIGKGISDFYLMSKYGLYKNDGNELELTVGEGIKLPTGNRFENDRNNKFYRDVRPGSGAYSFVGTFFIYKGFAGKKIKLFLTGRTEINGRDDEGYKFGNMHILSFFSNYNASRFMNLIIQFREEIKSRDKDPRKFNGVVDVSGSNRIFFVPQVSFTIKRKWFFGALYELPVYQFYNGKQMATTYGFALTLSREFQLKKE